MVLGVGHEETSLLRPWVSFAHVSPLKYHTVTCFYKEVILLFSSVSMVFSVMSGNSCHSASSGSGNQPNAFHSFHDYVRQEAVGGLPGPITA